MNSYVNFVNNHRKFLFVLLVVSIVVALLGIRQIRINPEFEIFTPRDSKYQQTLNEMEETFGTSNQIVFLVEKDSAALTPEVIASFREFQTFLKNASGVSEVKGPAPARIPAGKDGISLDRITEEKIQALREYFGRMGKLSPVNKKDGKVFGSFTVLPDDSFSKDDLHKIENYLEEKNVTFYTTGSQYLQQSLTDYILTILMFLPPAAFLLILLVFRIQMGSAKSTFLSVLPAGIGALWTMGLVGWSGGNVSIVTVIAPIFTIVIGSADGLHFMSHVQEERASGLGKVESIVESLGMVGMPIIVTTVTSMVGFLSLILINTEAIIDLALFAASGILLAGIATWCVLPLILTGGIKLGYSGREEAKGTSWMKKLWGIPSVVIVALVLILALVGLRLVNTEFNQLMIFRDFTEVQKNFKKIMAVNEGAIPVYGYVKTEGDPLDPATAKKIVDLEHSLRDSNYATRAISVYDYYSMMYSLAMNKGEPHYPSTTARASFLHSQISSGSSNPSESLLARDQKALRIMIFPRDLGNRTLSGIQEVVDEFDEKNANLSLSVTGEQYLMWDLNKNILSSQVKSIIVALLVVFVLLLVSLKRLLPAIVSLLPISLTTIFLYGFLGLSGISLNLFTATIFTITIGVGIDYAIHFTSTWENFKKRGHDSSKAAELAYSYTSRPILANAFGLAIGLSAMLLSPLKIHFYVSVLMWVAMVASSFLSLSFLPTILRRME